MSVYRVRVVKGRVQSTSFTRAIVELLSWARRRAYGLRYRSTKGWRLRREALSSKSSRDCDAVERRRRSYSVVVQDVE